MASAAVARSVEPDFKSAMRRLASGVAIITAKGEVDVALDMIKARAAS